MSYKFYPVIILFLIFFIAVLGWIVWDNISMASVQKPAAVKIIAPAAVAAVSEQPEKTFNILIIPGHDVDNGGANFKDIYERDLVATIGSEIADILNQNPKYKVIVSRSATDWNPILAQYFTDEKQQIIDWKNQCQANDKALMLAGKIKYVPDPANHAAATPDTSVKLYGMNKWANENNIDLVLNLHFNDEQRPHMNAPGDLKGFDIFIPESQMKNFTASRLAAQDIFDQLKKVEPVETNSLLQDQSLIALGASGTLNEPSMLIEYSYIYEKMLRTEPERDQALQQFAQQTAIGIENYVLSLNN